MPKMTTLTAAFGHFGATLRNPRWSWSAVSDDGKSVVVTIWDDEVGPDGSVDFFGHPRRDRWQHQIGNRFRKEDLIYAREKCGGLFRVVRIEAVDPTAKPRAIKNRRADPDAIMKLIKLDERTGEFSARLVR